MATCYRKSIPESVNNKGYFQKFLKEKKYDESHMTDDVLGDTILYMSLYLFCVHLRDKS